MNIQNIIKESNILYVSVGIATYEQVEKVFINSISQLNLPEPYFMKINMVLDRNNNPMGFCYIYISDSRIINAMLGKNFDGSERKIKKIINWDDPPEDYCLEEEKIENKYWGNSWAEITKCQEEISRLKYKYEEEKKQDSLIKMHRYIYNEKQKKIIKEKYPNEDHEKGAFIIQQCKNTLPEKPKYIPNILFCNKKSKYEGNSSYIYPEWLTKDMLKSIFMQYATRGAEKKIKKRFNGVEYFDTYPFIIDTPKGVTVVFDSNSNDATTALTMCKKMILINPNNKKEKGILYFYYQLAPRSIEKDY